MHSTNNAFHIAHLGNNDFGALGRQIVEQPPHLVEIPGVDAHRETGGQIHRDRRDEARAGRGRDDVQLQGLVGR